MSDPDFSEDTVEALYQRRVYPPMSHPVSDPAVSAVAALFGGLTTPVPAMSRFLEIGCASGHNLLPLAMRWPEATFIGIDLSEEMIRQAKERAAEAGVENVTFIAADLRTLEFPGESFDYIIAHGFFSWVPDDVKAALLAFCPRHLSPNGIATLSFNVSAGWESRMPVIEAARRIMAEHGADEMLALNVIREGIDDAHLRWVIDDMLAKGPEILAFDDFAPVMDAWPLDEFARACAASGLRWLGESDPAENVPSSLDDQARDSLLPLAGDPLALQMEADAIAATSFRSGVLCRADAPISPRMTTAIIFDLCLRLPQEMPASPDFLLSRVLEGVGRHHPDCVPVQEVLEGLGEWDAPAVARTIFQAITRGHLRARIEPTRIGSGILTLDRFRLLCARERLPLVDAWHAPCVFSEGPYRLLAEMDGTKSMAEMAALSKEICPDLAFPVWLEHLRERGLFSAGGTSR